MMKQLGIDEKQDGRRWKVAINALFAAVASLCVAVYITLFSLVVEQVRAGGSDCLGPVDPSALFRCLLVAVPLFVILVVLFSPVARGVRDFLFSYRYLIGALVVLAAVLLGVSGSSIATWSELIGGERLKGTILGIPRSIRSDEWLVSTPFAFSQDYSGYASVNDIIRGYDTDVTMVYAQPCWSFATLFRPFLWGYLVLGSERGLSFFWSARLVVLLLVSIEMGMFLTRGRRYASLAYAFAVAFSPLAQWWFAVNGIAELFIFGQGLVLSLHHWVRTKDKRVRLALTVLMSWLATGFLLVNYPAWQVPLFWIFLSVGVGDVWDFCRKATTAGVALPLSSYVRCGVLLVALTAIFSAICFVPVLSIIQTVSETVYPGQRRDNGGAGLDYVLVGTTGMFNALRAGEAPLNACESAGFLPLSPLGVISCGVIQVLSFRRTRRWSPPLLLLSLVEVLLLIYCVFGLPEIVSSVLLLSHSMPIRVAQILGYADIVVVFLTFAEGGSSIAGLDRVANHGRGGSRGNFPFSEEVRGRVFFVAMSVVAAIAVGCYAHYYLGLRWLYTCLLVVFTGCFLSAWRLFLRHGNDLPLLLIMLVYLVAGMCVNPVQQGTAALTESEAFTAVRELSEEDPDALWAADVASLGQLCVSAGARCVNSTNTYPVLERWKSVDTTLEFEDIYNRYAHITIDVTTEANCSFASSFPDTFTAALNAEHLGEMGVEYFISTQGNLDECSYAGWEFTLIDQAAHLYIWKLARQ